MCYLKVQEVIKTLTYKKFIKRIVDFILILILIVLFLIPIIFLFFISSYVTNSWGIFTQERVGKDGKPFLIYKIKTIDIKRNKSRFGIFLRKSKLDELPQLFNILFGEMSFVGPRPDVKEYTNTLSEEDKIILSFRPGLTGPATIKFLNEEQELNQSSNPEILMREYWKEKVKLNKEYVLNYYLYKDMFYLFNTLVYVFKNMVIKTSSDK